MSTTSMAEVCSAAPAGWWWRVVLFLQATAARTASGKAMP